MHALHRDLEFILSLDGQVDWVALSFVQQPSDMVEFRRLAGDKVKLMAKLEKPSAIEYLSEVSGGTASKSMLNLKRHFMSRVCFFVRAVYHRFAIREGYEPTFSHS